MGGGRGDPGRHRRRNGLPRTLRVGAHRRATPLRLLDDLHGRRRSDRRLREFAFSKRQAGDQRDPGPDRGLLGDPAAPFVAIQMLPLATHMPEFVRQNPMPLLSPKVMPRLWIGGPLRTQTHNDRDHNLACVIAGRRRFVLFPPEQVATSMSVRWTIRRRCRWSIPEAPDLARFPKYRDAYAAAQVAWLEPGDALFMPKYWWHHVTSLEPYNAMVNYWWGDTAWAGAGQRRLPDRPAGLQGPAAGRARLLERDVRDLCVRRSRRGHGAHPRRPARRAGNDEPVPARGVEAAAEDGLLRSPHDRRDWPSNP
jgi:hypothetical protein